MDFLRVTPKRRKVKLTSRNGVIYSNPPTGKKLIFYFGNLLFGVAVIYLIYLYYPLSKAIINYNRHLREPIVVALPTTKPVALTIAPNPTESPTPTPTPIITDEYVIEIPKILAKSEVAQNVSPYDPKIYREVLSTGKVAQSSTSNNPGDGMGKSTYIFAHSSDQGISMVRNNPVFYLLGELTSGDKINVNYHGQKLNYIVYQKKVVAASNIEYLHYGEPDKEVLILQTCWPIGTDWKRLLIFAQLVSN